MVFVLKKLCPITTDSSINHDTGGVNNNTDA